MADNTYDLVVIGGGPAGYSGAIRAAKLGRRAAVVEADKAGGTCLNRGCIPTKALLASAACFAGARRAGLFGVETGGVSFDYARMAARSREVVARLGAGLGFLLKKHGVALRAGTGRVAAPGRVEVTGADGATEVLRAEKILVATGCRPRVPEPLRGGGKRVLTSREALALEALPASVIVAGAGAVGVEFAWLFNTLGSRVTLVEMAGAVLPAEDADVSAALRRSLEKQGIEVRTGTRCGNARDTGAALRVELVSESGRGEAEAEVLLVAAGVEPALEGVFGGGLSPETERGFLKVDEGGRTSVEGVFAAGDVTGGPLLAHAASFGAVNAVNGMFGGAARKAGAVPACVFCHPEVAGVGMTEAEARASGRAVRTGKFPFSASGRAVASGETEGFVKLICEAGSGRLLGARLIGAGVAELAGELSLALELGATVSDLARTMHAHPTLAEALMEAAETLAEAARA